jgi:serine/threonine protein kinase
VSKVLNSAIFSRILLGETLNVLKISDFGTARNIGSSAKASLTYLFVRVFLFEYPFDSAGTVCYMAPEVIQQAGQLRYTYSADIYSLAITLWEIASRQFVHSVNSFILCF